MQKPVRVPPDLMAEFAQRARYVQGRRKLDFLVRFAVANVILQTPGAGDYAEEDLWAAIGRWNSSLRGIQQVDGVTAAHHGWAHVQRLRVALARAAQDPTLANITRFRHNQFIAAALKAMDQAMTKLVGAHPELLLTADEAVGMGVPVEHDDLASLPLFRKPKSKAGPKPGEPDPMYSPAADVLAERKARGAQSPALFAARETALERMADNARELGLD